MTKPMTRRGGDRISAALPSGHYTRSQLADRVGMPVDTLKRWIRDDVYVPDPKGHDETRGKVVFHVFTEQDAKDLHALCKARGVRCRARLPVLLTD